MESNSRGNLPVSRHGGGRPNMVSGKKRGIWESKTEDQWGYVNGFQEGTLGGSYVSREI